MFTIIQNEMKFFVFFFFLFSKQKKRELSSIQLTPKIIDYLPLDGFSFVTSCNFRIPTTKCVYISLKKKRNESM